MLRTLTCAGIWVLAASAAMAQSSSLYIEPTAPADARSALMQPIETTAPAAGTYAAQGNAVLTADQTGAAAGPYSAPAPPPGIARAPVPYRGGGESSQLAPALALSSLIAVRMPEPRLFAVHDLITIIVSERSENSSDAKLDTDKKTELEGEIKDFPSFTLKDLMDLKLMASENANPPKVAIEFEKKFEGDGGYTRKDTMTARITARVLDVKPNGTIVLEARKSIRSDKEGMEMIIMGTCRPQDITAQNTVLSTQLSDLRVIREHNGEVREATRKGLLTKLLETLFAF